MKNPLVAMVLIFFAFCAIGTIAGAYSDAMQPNTARELRACTTMCGYGGVQEFNSDGNGNTHCICNP